MSSTHTHAHTNRLAREKSPYLLQHQHNPVDWQPWGAEAFAQARAENKPVFLSIGYSTCHWCHVMERESFESETVAKFLNEHFISIKVDREERPDVDKIYMTFVQSTTGSGGWPLTCFLTPELKPFYGGTYFPPESKYGRPSFLDLLRQINQLWQTRREDLNASAAELHDKLAAMTEQTPPDEATLSPEVLAHAAAVFKQTFDPRHGGFGGAPKFPQPSQPSFLLRYGARFKDAEAVRMVLETCDQMAAGGIYDQLGGGFSRYSVDAEWLVPHFEKMLYDNAQLVNLYLDAFLVSGDSRHADTARGILRYILRDMTHPAGGFYSAEDADSEGKEGKFYCWTRAELSQLLTAEEFNVATRYFGITEQGNFVDHSDPHPLPNQNVLSIVQPKLAPADEPLLESAREKMFAARAKRIRPHLDDKILASWNGLMLGAMARAYAVLGDETYRAAALKNLAFLQEKLWDAKTRTLYHRWRDGERDSVQLQSAYAFLLAGTIDLYEATLEPSRLDFATALADAMIEKFCDREQGGFWQSAADAPDLILRVKEDYDGAEPSGMDSNAVPPYLRLGNVCITPIGFMDLTAAWRDKNAGSGIGTNFGSVPYNNAATAKNSELHFSPQNSRIGFRIDGNWKDVHFMGYNEFDFLSSAVPTSATVSNGAFVPRIRLYWVDVRKGKLEFLAGQSWSMMVPNRTGLSALPGDLFYSQVIDVNYMAGLTWTRQPGVRVIYHPSDKIAFGVSFENPDQYIGGSAGGSGITAPAALASIIGPQLDNTTANTNATPALIPDIIAKVAFDPSPRAHFEVAGIVSVFKAWDPLTNTYSTTSGRGGAINANFELVKGLRLVTNNFYGAGEGRYLFGQAPDVTLAAEGSLHAVNSGGFVEGFELNVKNWQWYTYFGDIYIDKNVLLDANGKTLIGYGYSGSPNSQNRNILEYTLGYIHTIWKDARYGALSWMGQYEYLTRDPWYVATGQPKNTHDSTIYFNIRYSLPGSMPKF